MVHCALCNSSISWSKTKGETHEETLTWSVDSQVSETFSVVDGALPCETPEEALTWSVTVDNQVQISSFRLEFIHPI